MNTQLSSRSERERAVYDESNVYRSGKISVVDGGTSLNVLTRNGENVN